MSNYHVLETAVKDCWSQVVFHIAVPNENNDAAVNLQEAMKQAMAAERAKTGDPVSRVPWLENDFPAEHTQIENGEIYEHFVTVEYSANLTMLQKRNIMDARYTTFASAIPNKIRSRLRFWGFDRDVP